MRTPKESSQQALALAYTAAECDARLLLFPGSDYPGTLTLNRRLTMMSVEYDGVIGDMAAAVGCPGPSIQDGTGGEGQ
jgi:hypothetical protein